MSRFFDCCFPSCAICPGRIAFCLTFESSPACRCPCSWSCPSAPRNGPLAAFGPETGSYFPQTICTLRAVSEGLLAAGCTCAAPSRSSLGSFSFHQVRFPRPPGPFCACLAEFLAPAPASQLSFGTA